MMAGDTPMMEDYEEKNVYMTDYVQKTPDYVKGGQTSEYCRTPGGG